MPSHASPSALDAPFPARLHGRLRQLDGSRGTIEPTARPAESRAHGGFILYWMRTAVRAHDNPALDTALLLGERHDLPVFVYHGLSESYPWASDRHHTFILEGARDVQAELRARGIGTAFHLEREGHRGPHLLELARQAAVVVTEESWMGFLRRWTTSMAHRISPIPVLAVESTLLFPLHHADPSASGRAYRFRKAHAPLWQRWLEEPWPDAPDPPAGRRHVVPELPFQGVELADSRIPNLVRQCDIDHGVGPVGHTPGGSRAGYARWTGFLEEGLAGYAGRRNDPLRAGVSRMSAYLHYGHVSPFRLARDAHEAGRDGGTRSGSGPGTRKQGGKAARKGADKYLDELLVWRGLAHLHTWLSEDPDALSALPDWAVETLRAHADDPRPALLTWETLARARTGDALWDAAQASLLRHGELHNNVRMTWGKQLLKWTPGPEEALRVMIDLNHRYALDGRDPNSYGGLHWCMGGLDRPFTPERPITGTVRSRSTATHARRLDVERWSQRTHQPALDEAPRVAVVGAGIAGLSAARVLADNGLEVVVLDKGRSVGGRASTRQSRGGWAMDHGAQYFTVRDPVTRPWLESWEAAGVVARWEGRIVRARWDADGSALAVEAARDSERWVGTPGMEALARHLARDLDVRTGVRVQAMEQVAEGRWSLGEDHGHFDAVLLTPPPAQSAALLRTVPPGAPGRDAARRFARRLDGAEVAPCWAAMVLVEGGEGASAPPPDGAFVEGGPLSWVARDSAKPGRKGGGAGADNGAGAGNGVEHWVLHGSPDWSQAHLEADEDEVARRLLEAFRELCAGGLAPELAPALASAEVQVHRWRHALPDPALPERCLWDAETGLGVAGDALGGPRIEGAFLGGRALAGQVLGEPPPRGSTPGGPPTRDAAGAHGPDPASQGDLFEEA